MKISYQSASILPTAARLVNCRADEILSLRVTDEGGLVVIAPSGRKMFFSPVQVENARAEVMEENRQKRPRRDTPKKRSP
jgi:hypothetical protein